MGRFLSFVNQVQSAKKSASTQETLTQAANLHVDTLIHSVAPAKNLAIAIICSQCWFFVYVSNIFL